MIATVNSDSLANEKKLDVTDPVYGIHFRIIVERNGFILKHPCMSFVGVSFHQTYLLIEDGDEEFDPVCCNFYERYALIDAIIDFLTYNLYPEEDEDIDSYRAKVQIKMALAGTIKDEVLRLLEKADPMVLAAHKAIFTVRPTRHRSDLPDNQMGLMRLEFNKHLYWDERNSNILLDIINLRAAATAAAFIRYLLPDEDADFLLKLSSKCDQLFLDPLNIDRICGQGFLFEDHEREYSESINDELEKNLLDYLRNWGWISLFSDTGRPYRALNVSLSRLPPYLPGRLLIDNLRRVHLVRPLTNRTELLFNLLYEEKRYGETQRTGKPCDRNIKALKSANSKQILKSMRLASEYIGDKLDGRRTGHISLLVDFLFDCPVSHNGNVIGLARKSIKWHSKARQKELIDEVLKIFGENMECAKPPIRLPAKKGIRFLRNVCDLANESARMDHCVVTYAENCVSGFCYIFHVDHKSEMATIEVDYTGKVVQVKGPGNQINNKACRYGRQILENWGKNIKNPKYFVVLHAREDSNL